MPVQPFSAADALGAGNLLAVYGGSPPAVEVFGGVIQHAEVVETTGATLPATAATGVRRGDPLILDGVTVWLQGALLADARGVPTAADYAAALARWDAVRAKLLSADYGPAMTGAAALVLTSLLHRYRCCRRVRGPRCRCRKA